MKVSRRYFLAGVSAAALFAGPSNAGLGLHGSVVTPFNGGKSQVNFNFLGGNSGEYPFLDYVKTAQAWDYGSGPNANGQVSPQYNDVNGYPTQTPSNSGYYSVITIPPTTVRPGTYTIMWNGGDAGTIIDYFGTPVTYNITGATQAAQCVLAIGPHALAVGQFVQPQSVGGMTQLNFNTYQIVAVGPTTITLNVNSSGFGAYTSGGALVQERYGTNSQLVVQPNPSATPLQVSFGLSAISTSPPTNYVSKIAIVYTADLPLYDAGEIFGTQFKSVLRQGGFGVYRYLNWALSGICNISTWATRKPVNYFTYADQEYRASLFGGTTSEGSFNGFDYALPTPNASPTPYAWPGWTSGAPIDKQTIHLYFDQNATFYSSAITFSGTTTVNWPAHGFSGGEPIGFNGNLPANISLGQNYYVLTAGLTTGSFQVGLTPSGSPVAYGSGGSGTITGIRLPTLNLNSGGAIPLKMWTGILMYNSGFYPVASISSEAVMATLVYDADLNSWLVSGANSQFYSQGLGNGCPYEIMLQLCKEMGAHPWFTAPFMAVDPMTDFHTQLASYIKQNMPSWMIPRFETCNELWGNLSNNYACAYATCKSFAHWNVQFGSGVDLNNWQGKTASTIGQALNAAYGGTVGNLYQMVNGQWTTQFASSGANGFAARLASTSYVGQSQAAQAGYSKSAAYLSGTHVCNVNYFNPTERATSQETTDAATFAGEAAQFTGTISGGVLTVASVGSNFGGVGTIAIGQTLTDQYGFIPAGVTITGGSSTSWTVSNNTLVYPPSPANSTNGVMLAMSAAATALATAYADTCGGAAASSGDGAPNLALLKTNIQNCLTWAATYTNSAGNPIGGNFYEGGYSPDLSSTNQVNFLRYVSKFSSDIGLMITGGTLANSYVVTGNYADCLAAGGSFPSLFEFGGIGNVWPLLDPDVYVTPQSSQFRAIEAFN